jgi:hypothetical protein
MGPNKTLRIMAIIVGGALLIALPFMRSRLPTNRVHGSAKSGILTGLFYFKFNDRLLWMLFIANLTHSVACVSHVHEICVYLSTVAGITYH